MTLPRFELERYFARHEFSAAYNLSTSDVQGWSMADVLALADPEVTAWWGDLHLGYTETTGHPLLREAIAGLYDDITADEVHTFSGAQEAIFAVMHALVRPGDHAVVMTPSYASLTDLPRHLGAEVTELRLREDDGWAFTAQRVRSAVSPRTKLVVLNLPHNPTGALPTVAEFADIVRAATAGGATLVSDEVYRFLEHGGRSTLPAAADLSPRAVSIGVMSKSFALAGLRIGWIATRDHALRQRAAEVRDLTSICSSAPSEVLATIALREREVVLAHSRDVVAGNLELWDDFFDGFDGAFSWVRPQGGSIGFPRLLGGVPIRRFAEELLREEDVLIAPGDLFGQSGEHFRIGLGRLDTLEGLERLSKFTNRWLSAYKR